MQVFVYGTLKQGYGNHPVIKYSGGDFISTILTPPLYDLIDLGYFPGIVAGEYSV